MPRRAALSAADRMALLGLPLTPEGLIQHYTLSDADLDVVRKHRGNHNRLGFAVQFCYLRYPGCALAPDGIPPSRLLDFLGPQIDVDPRVWERYAGRAQTRREHLVELQHYLDLTSFGLSQYRLGLNHVALLAEETDRGLVLANRLVERLRAERIIVPPLEVIERLCAEALSQGERRVFEILTQRLSVLNRRKLDRLINRNRTKVSRLAWLREPPPAPKARHVLVHLDRLQLIRELQFPADLAQGIHPGRLLKLAREGGQMTAQHLRDLEDNRRYATLAALLLDIQRTIIDDLVHMHDRIVGDLFSLARHNHADQFQKSGKAINDKVRLYSRIGRALLKAKEDGRDPFSAIEEILPWEAFSESVAEAEKLAQPEAFDYLPLVGDGYGKLRRYTPALLDALALHAAPAARDVLAAVEVLRETNRRQARMIPQDAPTSFVRKRWVDLVHTPDGLDRRFYEICVLAEVKNAIRSGDIWVEGSRQYRDFQEYLLPTARYRDLRDRQELGLAVETQCDRFLEARLALLERQLAAVEPLAQQGELPGVSITETGLKVSPLIKAVPDEAEELTRQAYGLLPRVRITDVLLEVDSWTDFSRHFTHLKSGESVRDRSLLLTAVLADAINLGLAKMADACPGVSYPKLSWLQAWHIRDETYTTALAELVNAQFRQPFAAWWGAGTTSSSDGQNFRTGGRGDVRGLVNARYGPEPGVQFYTHISDQYAPFHTTVINATARDATFVLDGLLQHESDLRIEEHYTDTAGFTDHVFALMHLLGYRFAPRIRDLADKRLFIHQSASRYPTLAGLVGGKLNLKAIRSHWDDILRLASSIQHGVVTASMMLRKLGSYPRQNGLAMALRELGRLERTLFTLDWFQDMDLRRRVQIGLNKGEARNTLAEAVFLNRLGEVRDRSFENQRYRASGLNLVVAAIVLWNTVYLERAVDVLRSRGVEVSDVLLPHVSPLGWEHISLTGDYIWKKNRRVEQGSLRSMRGLHNA